MQALVTSPALERLTVLHLSRCALLHDEVRELALSPGLPRLHTLSLYGNTQLKDGGIRALAGSPLLARLSVLDLGHTGITLSGLRDLLGALADSPVHTLHLADALLGDRAAEAVAASPSLNRLCTLDLRGNGISDSGAHALGASPRLPGLVSLDLSRNNIGKAGAEALARGRGNLARIHLADNPIAARACQSLRSRFGDRLVL
jgi:Ran GTPase-activating protein (RanGAP) involved in mRNA processing and transport